MKLRLIIRSVSRLLRVADLLPISSGGISSFDFIGKPVLAPFQGAGIFYHLADEPRSGAQLNSMDKSGGGRAISVAIVEDERGVRESLAKFLNGTADFKCVAECENTEAALKNLPGIRPDVVLMDINLPGRSGIECTAELRQLLPDTEVIMLTIEEDSDRVFDSMKAGASGYLVKHSSPETILEAISEVHRGGAPISSLIARKVFAAFRLPPPAEIVDAVLSDREEQVLKFVSQGYRNKEIAEELRIAVGTVNTFVRNIYRKLHVRSRAEAVAARQRPPRK
jgi:DNA-binding NarL/FixJ family response regulator